MRIKITRFYAKSENFAWSHDRETVTFRNSEQRVWAILQPYPHLINMGNYPAKVSKVVIAENYHQ